MILLSLALALPSDFSALRQQPMQPVTLVSYNEEQTLLDLLRDGDVNVRREAVRSLKTYVISRSSTRDRVIDVLRDGQEDLSVRRQAAKTLAAASNDNRVQDALLDIVRRDRDAAVRAAAVTALGRDPEAVTARFHLLRRNRNGGIIGDPLDAE